MLSQTRFFRGLDFVGLWLACATCVWGADFSEANRHLRDGAIQYGNAHFDATTNLVWRVDGGHHELDVCQHSLEYAAALFNASQQIERANAVLSSVLNHQDLGDESPTFGNFLWWHGETRVRDRNAVCFMTPWLAHVALEYRDKLTAENTKRLHQSLQHCIRGVRGHRSGPDYTNIWLLKAASLVMLGRVLDRAELESDGAERIQQWIDLVSENGIGEYNSPCYNAVDVYALEWIYHYAVSPQLRSKVAGCLDYLYADIFQNWHWEAAIGAGTHSRAYERDRDSGLSLVSCLLFKQCGQSLRQPLRSFLYVFAVNDYPVPSHIRAMATKKDRYPFSMRYRVLHDAAAVECRLYMTPQFSLGTQTGRRPVYNDRPLWDIPFKITYAGSKHERRASYISPIPTTRHATVGSLQHGPLAIVLYEVDMKDSKLNRGLFRLDIEPSDGGMCDEIRVEGRDYDRTALKLTQGAVVGWRVADTLVAVRLLRSRGVAPEHPDVRGDVAYRIGPTSESGLRIECPLTPQGGPHTTNHLNAGFVVACSTTSQFKTLADFLDAFTGWTVAEQLEDTRRTVDWHAGQSHLQLIWDEAANRVISQTIDGLPVNEELRYESPLIQIRDGQPPAVVAESKEP